MNSSSDHPDRARLTEFAHGQLDSVAHDAVAEHVAACDACCAVLREVPEDPFLVRLRDAGIPLTVNPAPADQPLPPELLAHARYKVGKFLGAGGMGLVYQAEHRLMDRVVALKILHHHLVRRQRIVQRFRQEVKAAARLSHPNIVAAYDADQAGPAHFLVMEFVDGMSLHRLVSKRGPLEPAYACYFIRQAAKGLAHAHEADMVHRDIKPQNLMLTRKGQVKILDFGLARLASEISTGDEASSLAAAGEAPAQHDESLTRLGDIMGTPAYMAPEQIIDPSQADIRADIYSLGCTLYFLLTGKTPLGSSSAARAKVLAREYVAPRPIRELRDDLPTGLLTVIDRMLSRMPGDRFQAPGEVTKALAPFARPAPPSKPETVQAPPMAANTTPPPDAPIVDIATTAPQNFLARCPFCLTRIRIPARVLGASLPCPHCGSYFTAVPEEDSGTRQER